MINKLLCTLFKHSTKLTYSECPYTMNIYTICQRCNEVIYAKRVN